MGKHANNPDVLKRLVALMEPYLDYALAHPHLFDHAFSVRRDDARRFPEDFHARQSPTLNVIADAVAEGVAARRAEAGRSVGRGDVAVGAAHGLVALYRAGRFSYDEAQFRAFYSAIAGETDRWHQGLIVLRCRRG